MSKGAFSNFFGGTMGVLFALLFFFIGLPMLACVGCFGLAIVGSSSSPRDSDSRPTHLPISTTKDESTDIDTSSAEATTPVSAESESPADTSARTATTELPKVHKVGDTVSVGYTSYCVWKAWWSDRLSTNEFLDQPPDASYLFLELTVRNNDKKARLIPPLKLIDENDAEYQASAKGWAVERSIGVLDSLNPGVSKQGLMVFDVPRNHTYRLKVSGGYWSVEDTLIEITVVDPEATARQSAEREAEEQRQREEELARARAVQEAMKELKAAEQQKAIEDAKWKTWMSAGGGFRVEAKFVKFVNGTVTLERKDGTTFDVSIDKLSADDQDFIKNRKWLDR